MVKRLLVLLFATVPALAQVGDLSVSFHEESGRIPAPSFYGYSVRVQWTGAEPARDVVLEVDVPGTIFDVSAHVPGVQCTKVSPVRCTIPLLRAGSQFAGITIGTTAPSAGTYVASATVTTRTPESSTANNSATHTLIVTGQADLRGGVGFLTTTIDPGAEGVMVFSMGNNGDTATNVVGRVRLENGGELLRVEYMPPFSGAVQPQCTIENGEAVCRVDVLRNQQYTAGVRLHYRAPERLEGGKVVVGVTVDSDGDDFDPRNDASIAELVLRRMFVVTSSADAGPGTLRQAMLDTRGTCDVSPCTIAFAGVTAIQPLTALPAIGGMLRIDGRATRVELDGSRLDFGDGLHFANGCHLEVRHLAIRNFPGHGLEARQITSHLSSCSRAERGLYVTDTWFSGNTRGIVTQGMDASLTANVIHDHRRAGIFIDDAYYTVVKNNVIVNNGASGVFVNASPLPRHGIASGAEITENVIHGNVEWGVARTAQGMVEVRENSIARNGLYGIDVGLDLSTPNRDNPSRTGVPNKPVLLSATYDPAANQTVVRVLAPTPAGKIDLYASASLSTRGYPEAERWLRWEWARPTQFDMRVDGDLRGQWITATASVYTTLYFLREEGAPATNVGRPPTGVDTSELSDAIQVR